MQRIAYSLAPSETVKFSPELQRKPYRSGLFRPCTVMRRRTKNGACRQFELQRYFNCKQTDAVDFHRNRRCKERKPVQASAVLVVDDRCLSSTASNAELAYKGRSANKTRSVACAEIFGESLLSRTVRRLRNSGIRTISIVGASIYPLGKLNAGIRYVTAPRSRQCWPAAQQEVMRLYAEGVQTVFMIGVHAYIEWDVEEVLRFHLAHGLPLTQLHDAQGPLEVWAVESEWFSSAAFGCTLPFRYGEFPGLPISCPITGYVNRLTKGEDLRRFVEDGFLSRCETRPQCDEVKPGVWVEDGARVHRSPRLGAPGSLGASPKRGAPASITRFR